MRSIETPAEVWLAGVKLKYHVTSTEMLLLLEDPRATEQIRKKKSKSYI